MDDIDCTLYYFKSIPHLSKSKYFIKIIFIKNIRYVLKMFWTEYYITLLSKISGYNRISIAMTSQTV